MAQCGLSQKKLTPTLIVGIALAVLIVIGLAAWLVVRALSKRNTAQREDARGAAFLNVRGLVNESDQKRSVSRSVLRLRLCSHAPSYGLAMKGDLFSRNQMSENVVLPEKTVIAGGSGDVKQEILQLYAAEGKLPRPFAPFMGSVEKLAAPVCTLHGQRREARRARRHGGQGDIPAVVRY